MIARYARAGPEQLPKMNSLFDDGADVCDLPVSINGTTYPNSISWWSTSADCYFDSGGIEPYGSSGDTNADAYNLERSCYQLQGDAGITDDSDSGSQVDLTIADDGNTVWNTTLNLGSTYPINLNITNVLRISIEPQLLAGNSVTAAIGNARVLCS